MLNGICELLFLINCILVNVIYKYYFYYLIAFLFTYHYFHFLFTGLFLESAGKSYIFI